MSSEKTSENKKKKKKPWWLKLLLAFRPHVKMGQDGKPQELGGKFTFKW